MSQRVKWLVAALLAATAVSVIAVVFMAAHRPDRGEEDEEEAVKAPSHVQKENERTVLRLSAATLAREGIRVEPVQQQTRRAELRGMAVLLPAGELAGLRNSYVAARARVARDELQIKVARSQYQRIKTLYQQNQNMSLKAMQDAQAAYGASQAQIEADEQEAELQLDTARQRWGPVVAGWIAENSRSLAELLQQRSYLAQVIFPPGEVAKPPGALSLSSPGNHLLPARLVGSLPQVNPQIQGVSFLYRVASQPGLAAGMNLVVFVPVGPLLRGSVVPETAVVWWQGKAWAYQETSNNTFARREVPTGNPLPSGYFVPGSAFAPNTKLVTAGAQALLSEEFRGQIQEED